MKTGGLRVARFLFVYNVANASHANDHFPSPPRKRGARLLNLIWIPAFAGMTMRHEGIHKNPNTGFVNSLKRAACGSPVFLFAKLPETPYVVDDYTSDCGANPYMWIRGKLPP
jgi:hypothetical protein